MKIGALRHLVTVRHPSATVDPPMWWCAIEPAAGPVVDGVTAFVVRGRYHPGITIETELVFSGRVLQVQGVTDVEARQIELVLLCVEVVARGGKSAAS